MKKRGGRSRGKSKRGVYGPPDDLPDLHPDSDSESEAEDEECDWFEEEEQKQSKTLEECDHSDDDLEVAPDLSLPFSNQDETAQVNTAIVPENRGYCKNSTYKAIKESDESSFTSGCLPCSSTGFS